MTHHPATSLLLDARHQRLGRLCEICCNVQRPRETERGTAKLEFLNKQREDRDLQEIFELLETPVLLTGFDNPVGDVHQMDWLVCWNGKSFDAARFNEAADENAVATFACRIMFNVRGLQGNQDDK